MTDERERRTSDVPVDLGREREHVVRQFLRRGVEVTEEVLAENRELRTLLAGLREEATRLRSQIASDDAIRDLLRKIETLEHERGALLTKGAQLEERKQESEHRHEEIEQELHDLANLYIASSHLHSTLSVRGVVRHVMELLQQLLGAERYALYVTDDGKTARPLAWEKMDRPPLVQFGEGPAGEAMATGLSRIAPDPTVRGTPERPLAVVPLAIKDTCVGVIVVETVFGQKERWAAVDRELMDMMGTHAAIALVAASMFAGTGDAHASLRGIEAHLSDRALTEAAQPASPGRKGAGNG